MPIPALTGFTGDKVDIGDYIDGIVLALVTKTINHAASVADIRAGLILYKAEMDKVRQTGRSYCDAGHGLAGILAQAAELENEIAGISRDLNEVMGSVEDMNDLRLKASAESRSKSTFLARMSHELRTPMNAILGFSELAQSSFGTSKTLEYISGIRLAGESLLAVINDILDFSKIESGRLAIEPGLYDTGSVLNDALSICRLRLQEKPVKLITAIEPKIPAVLEGDAARVRQVLLNIMDNSVKYTERGFIRLTVTFDEIPDSHGLLTFKVEDSGIGIRSGDLPNLFMEFARFSEQSGLSPGGAGLGLSITRSLCRAMGGDITAESEFGRGSIFTATLVQKIKDRRPMGEISFKALAPAGTGKVSFRAPEADILLVDDMPSNLLVAEGLLASYGARIFSCHSGQEAVELVRLRSFDIIFMDHMMPGMDGLETARAIRNLSGGEQIPIVALTANAVCGMREMFLKNGFSDFLPKPIEAAKLSVIMERWIPEFKRKPPCESEPGPTEPETELAAIEGLNVEAGLSKVGGAKKRYLNLLETFVADARGRLPMLELKPGAAIDPECIVSQAHALKSILASVGAQNLAELAGNLEEAGRRDDRDRILWNIKTFGVKLEALLARIETYLARVRPRSENTPAPESGVVRDLLQKLKKALEADDIDTMDLVMDRLKDLTLDNRLREALAAISEKILTADFSEAQDRLSAVLNVYSAWTPDTAASLSSGF
ncbi:MAG: response regulator [Deltaproteobacteria bacterium]|nr:response regulator [Deltaproteobacteria bacterium]